MITSSTNPPALPSHGVYWERQPDPFHASAILPALEQAGLQAANPEVLNHGEQRGGWMLIDWAENPIGWVPDGTEVPDHDQQFEFREGPCKHMCAYRVGGAA